MIERCALADPVGSYQDSVPDYYLQHIPPEQVFMSRILEVSGPDDLERHIALLQGLTYFDIKIAPFAVKATLFANEHPEYMLETTEISGTVSPDISDRAVAVAYDDLAVGLTHYFYDRLSSRTEFLTDIAKHTQFVYGTHLNAQSDGFYLVDLDLYKGSGMHEALKELESLEQDFIAPLVNADPAADLFAPAVLKEVLLEIENFPGSEIDSNRIALTGLLRSINTYPG